MYIVLEGVVGTGKSTQSALLVDYFQHIYPEKQVILVREPGGTPIAEAIRILVQGTTFADDRMHALTDAYLYAAARAQLIHTKIAPVLDTGGIVVSDRNVCSSLAYQGYAQGLGIECVWDINYEGIKDYLPDHICFMDMDVATGLARTFDADGDKWELQQQDFFDKVYAGYHELFTFAPLADRMCRIDAQGSIEEVMHRLHQALGIV